MQLKIPPPVYALLVAILMWLLSRFFPVATVIFAPYHNLGIVLILIAGLGDIWSLFLFGKKRTTPNPMRPEFTTGLVTDGLYRFSRNPMYVGMLFILIGFAVFLGQLTPFLVIPLFYFVITEMQIKPEERILEDKFGDDYLAYKNKVRRWL